MNRYLISLLAAYSYAQEPWTVLGSFVKNRDVSGAALLSPSRGLLVSDETRAAQCFTLDAEKRSLTPGDLLPLLPGKGKEADLEALTLSTDKRYCYITGSHAVSRKDGEVKPDRLHIFRLSVDEQGSAHLKDTASLKSTILAQPELASHLGKPPEQGGLDIEALAERDGQLYVGLRSPAGFVLSVNAEALFQNPAQAQAKLHTLALGEDRGVRDMIALKQGYLLLVGPSAEQEKSFTLHWWDGTSLLKQVATLPDNKAKAETLLLLSENEGDITCLVMFDGLPNGHPVAMSLKVEHP